MSKSKFYLFSCIPKAATTTASPLPPWIGRAPQPPSSDYELHDYEPAWGGPTPKTLYNDANLAPAWADTTAKTLYYDTDLEVGAPTEQNVGGMSSGAVAAIVIVFLVCAMLGSYIAHACLFAKCAGYRTCCKDCRKNCKPMCCKCDATKILQPFKAEAEAEAEA